MWETKKNILPRRLAIIKYAVMDLFAKDVQSGLKDTTGTEKALLTTSVHTCDGDGNFADIQPR